MKSKGFTLIEIIGGIVIVGILGVLAVVTFTGSMRGFREDYYTETVRTLTESGKEFFNDNRKYRPSDVLSAQTVPISTLVSQKYLDEVVDYKGNKCSNSSYVIIIKKGKDDYDYHACLVCAEDDYNNMQDKYCDSAWQTPTQIEYEVSTPPDLYVYKGTPRASLNDELAIKVSYVKKNSKGEVLGVVDGKGFDDVPTIYPGNVDIVDTNKVGRYELNYVYNGKTIKGSVTVYEYLHPGETITKENVVATDLHGGTRVEKGAYTSGEWTQKIYVKLTPGTVNAGDADISKARLRNVVNRYQWNKDGVWQDFCTGDNCSNIPVVVEMNENIKFRSIDLEERISNETEQTTIRIDNTKPTCSLETVGEHKGNDWFTSDVAINFVTNKDLVRTSSEAVSGVRVSNITISDGSFQNSTSNLTSTHNYDKAEVTYIGYVEDNAKNFITCDIKFKRDATNPTCSSTSYGKDATSGVDVTIKCGDELSKCISNSYSKENAKSSGSITIEDNAGNTKDCSYLISSYTQYSTRTWNTCKDGGECIEGYDESYKCAISSPGSNCEWVSSDTTTCNSMYGYDYWKCKVYNSCKDKTPCIGGWEDWTAYKKGNCSGKRTSEMECNERTMYHGG